MAESSLSRSNIRRISPVRTEGGSASGSNIPVAGARSRYDEARATLERGLLESRRRQVLGNAPAQTPGTTPAADARPAATPTAAPASSVPPLLARPQPAAPARQGMIDGRPANRVINDMEGSAQARGNFGAEIANRNVEKMGVQGAVADYFERNRLDRDPGPSNMAEVRQSLVQGPPTASVAGPAQRAMLESRQRRGEALMQGPVDNGSTLANARATAAGASVLRTPTAGAQLQNPSLALRSEGYVNAATGRVDSSMPSKTAMPEQAGPPLLARPSRPVAAAPEPPAIVTRTNEFAQSLRDRANTPYQQRMTEGGITIDDMKKSAGGLVRSISRLPDKARAFSERTNQAAENFRRKYAP